MASKLNPYISFKDKARAAMEFYQTVFGGKLTLMAADTNMSISLSGDNEGELSGYYEKLAAGGTIH